MTVAPAASINITGNDGAVIIFDRFTEERTAEAVFLGKDFAEPKKVSVSGKYVCSDGSDSHTAIYCSGTASVFDNAGEKTATLSSEQDAILIELGKESLFAITRDQFCEIKE